MKKYLFNLTQFLLLLVSYLISFVNKKMYVKLVNSSVWFNIYYKHTTQHKQDLKETRNRVLEIRKKIIGK